MNYKKLQLFWFVLAAICHYQAIASPDAALQPRMAVLLQQQQLTGVIWSTVTPEGIRTGAAGIADSDQQSLLRADHKMPVGSIAKTLIAVGILRLVSEGKLSLDSPLAILLPDLPVDQLLDNPWAAEQPVLLRHLLDHTSGLDDVRLWQVFSLRATPDSPLSQAFKPGSSMRLRTKPGSRLSYSNMGYTVLGMVIEQVSGERYERYLEQHLLQPLQMFDSSFGFITQQEPAADPRLAMGHFENNVTQATVPMFLRPAGQFTTTSTDMALFASFLMSDGVIHHDINDDVNEETNDISNRKPFIAPELLRAMGQPTTTEAAQAGLVAGYALGLNNRDRHGVIGRCHVGTTFGFRANFCLFPEAQKAFFVAMNADVETANYDQFDALLVQELGLARLAPMPPPTAVLPQDIANWLGFYQLAPSRMESFRYLDLLLNFATLQLAETQQGEQLQLKPFQGAARLLTPVGGRLFRANDRITASHVLLDSAERKRVISDGFRSYQQVSIWQLLPLWASAITGVIGLGFVLIAGLLRFLRKDSLISRWRHNDPLLPPFSAVVFLLLPLPLFFGQSFLQLGELTLASAALALVSGLLPIAMLLGIWHWLLRQAAFRSGAVKDRGKSSVPELLAMIAVLQWSLVLVYWGLLPLRLWA
jgi:CubicO group peptidase (beta-lactamase class C family)